MAKRKKAEPDSTETPLETPVSPTTSEPEPEKTDTPTVIEPPPQSPSEPERTRQPDPFGLASVALTDEKDGPTARLFRNQRFQVMAISFPDKPEQDIIEQLRDDGWKWKSDDKVWEKRIDPTAKWQTHANAEKLFTKLTDEIRAANGCGQSIS